MKLIWSKVAPGRRPAQGEGESLLAFVAVCPLLVIRKMI